MKEITPKRKQIRLKEYDYSTEGMYFITICTKNRECILSKIKNVGVDAHIDPKKEKIQIELLRAGEIVKKYIDNYSEKFNNIKIVKYVIMPNHLHFIIELRKRVDVGIDPYNS